MDTFARVWCHIGYVCKDLMPLWILNSFTGICWVPRCRTPIVPLPRHFAPRSRNIAKQMYRDFTSPDVTPFKLFLLTIAGKDLVSFDNNLVSNRFLKLHKRRGNFFSQEHLMFEQNQSRSNVSIPVISLSVVRNSQLLVN